MSDTEEFQAVDVHDLEEEEALSDDEVIPEPVDDPNRGEVGPRPLVPLDRRGASKIRIGDEFRLWNNYDLLPLVLLHFQNPVTLEIRGGDIVIYERMLLAGLRLPFLEIVRELILYLGVSPSQIAPNAWRYLFAPFILWRTVLEAQMTIPKFFNIYRVNYKREGVVEFTVRENPIFIYLSQSYSNNRGWRSEFFRVSGEWELSGPMADDRRILREWRPIQIDLREPPALNATGRRRVATMLTFSQTPTNVLKIDYDNIVTDENMRKVLKYNIPPGKVWYDRKGKTMVRKFGSEAAATPRVMASGIAFGPKKSVKPKTDALKAKKVGKQTVIPRAAGHPPTVSAQVTIPEWRSTGGSRKEALPTSASIAPLESATLAKETVEASREEVPPASSESLPAGVAPAPGSEVIEIEDAVDEPEREVPSVQSAAKRKGKGKVQGSTKRTRFASDPRGYALTQANEAELLFGRLCFVLPTVPVAQETLEKSSLPNSVTLAAPFSGEPVDQSSVAKNEACSESNAGVIHEDQLPEETEALLSPGDGLGTQECLETEAVNLLEPVQKGSDPTIVVDSPGVERLEETDASRLGELINSLREGLLACPLEALMKILPEGFSSAPGIGSPVELAEVILHSQLQVSFMPNFLYPLFSLSHFFFFRV
jgi:hypothetical protein